MGLDFLEALANFKKRSKRSFTSKTRFSQTLVLLGLPVLILISSFSHQIRQTAMDMSVTLLSWVENPVDYVASIPENLSLYFNQKDRLAQLDEKLRYIQGVENRLIQLKEENRQLKQLLEIPQSVDSQFTAKCVGKHLQGDHHILYIQAGQRQGIQKGQPVMAQDALIGVVENVGFYTSRILLITDPSFNVPVRSLQSLNDGIISGNGRGDLTMKYVQDNKTIIPSEVVVTSGIGGVFPPDLVVGSVQSIHSDGPQVSPHIDLKHLSYVNILKTSEKPQSTEAAHD